MAVLNILSASLDVTPPSGMWEALLRLFGFIGNYGWRIIVFSVILKLLLSPLDFYQKYKMKKNQRITKNLEPEIERLQHQYGNDKQGLQREQSRLQRSMGFSYFSSCIPMIITLVVFFTFFAGMRNISQYEEFKQYVDLYGEYSKEYTELTGLSVPGFDAPAEYDDGEFNRIIIEWGENPDLTASEREAYEVFEENDSSFKNLHDKKVDYEEFLSALNKAKNAAADKQQEAMDTLNANEKLLLAMDRDEYTDITQVEEDYDAVADEVDRLKPAVGEGGVLLALAEQRSSEAAANYYQENNNRFLWIKSIWTADAPWQKAIPDFETFRKRFNATEGCKSYNRYFDPNPSSGKYESGLNSKVLSELNKESTYNKVTGKISELPMVKGKNGKGENGYLILAILAVGFSMLSQFITTRQQKRSGQVTAQGGTMKAMMFVMPVITGVFAVMYTASFAIYMITNSVMSLLINMLSTATIGFISKRKSKDEVSDTGIVRYGRRDPNDRKK